MEVDQEISTSPFWRQSSSDHRGGRRLRRTSSIALNSGAVMIAVIVAALAFVFVVVPSIASFGSQVFRPQSVKKGWDSLNLVLVLFAVVCGFIGRSSGGELRETPKWRDVKHEESSDRNAVFGRMRSSSSYPDLRQESPWTVDERWRFHDDTDVGDHHRASDSDYHHLRYHGRSWQEDHHRGGGELKTKNIEVDTFEVRASEEDSSPAKEVKPEEPSPPPTPTRPRSPYPPPPPKKVAGKRKPKRSYRAVGEVKEETEQTENRDFSEASQPLPPSRPPPPAPPLPPPPPRRSSEYQEMEQSTGVKSEKKRGKEFLISLRRKKKKQRQKSVENFEAIFASSDPNPPQHFTSPPLPPPPPPPPPPPSSVFMNLFSPRRVKTRRSESPPTVRVSRSTTQIRPAPVARRQAMPTESSVEVIGNESPLNPIPPPPPPPPFRVREWKFPTRGDFVRVTSGNSSRSASPDPYGGESSPAEGESPMSEASAAATGISPAMSPAMTFCPSPDVDTKADNFIARFRAGLVLEKENSFRQRDGIGGSGKSRLGREQ